MTFNTYFLSLGSNQGDRHYYLQQAQTRISQIKGVTLTKASRIYETSPVNCPDGSPNFLNMVIECQVLMKPVDFLGNMKTIEQAFGRKQDELNMPRFLDIDILFVDDSIIAECNLIVPHPEAHQRLFVMKPFMDICADFTHPILQTSIKDIYNALLESSHETVQLWTPEYSQS